MRKGLACVPGHNQRSTCAMSDHAYGAADCEPAAYGLRSGALTWREQTSLRTVRKSGSRGRADVIDLRNAFGAKPDEVSGLNPRISGLPDATEVTRVNATSLPAPCSDRD